MDNILFLMLLGHFVGDYLLQPLWMAKGKMENTTYGAGICALHSFIYTLVVAIFIGLFSDSVESFTIFFIISHISHYFIDRYSLGNLWLKLIQGRWIDKRKLRHPILNREEGFSIGFSAIVYAVVDNTWHILIMFFTLLALGVV